MDNLNSKEEENQIKFPSENNIIDDPGVNSIREKYHSDNSQSIRHEKNLETNNSALHFFLYLVSFLSLSFLATGLGSILYQIINKFYSGKEGFYSYYGSFTQSSVKFGLASIIIATPIFFILSFLITKYIFEGKILENSKVRKWITYIILFFASTIILGDLIVLVYNWLGGDMMIRFILKVLVILLIAGSIFGYYFWNMRKKNMVGIKYFGNKMAAGASLVAILVVFAGSFFIIDGPKLTRDKKSDVSTINRIKNYHSAIELYYQKNGKLPESLSNLDSYKATDENEITYSRTGELNYKLCSNFKTSDLETSNSDKWKHDKGMQCFDQNLTPNDKSMKGNSISNSLIEENSSNGNSISSESTSQSEERTKLIRVRSAFNEISIRAMICQDAKGTIESGNGGDLLCGNKHDKWPKISYCGNNSEDTKWIVSNGSTENWTITLKCKNFEKCNGATNAICRANGCSFNGSCK